MYMYSRVGRHKRSLEVNFFISNLKVGRYQDTEESVHGYVKIGHKKFTSGYLFVRLLSYGYPPTLSPKCFTLN